MADKKCKFPGCAQKAESRGLCQKHYWQARNSANAATKKKAAECMDAPKRKGGGARKPAPVATTPRSADAKGPKIDEMTGRVLHDDVVAAVHEAALHTAIEAAAPRRGHPLRQQGGGQGRPDGPGNRQDRRSPDIQGRQQAQDRLIVTPGEHSKLLDDLVGLSYPDHPDYMVVEFYDKEIEFIEDIEAQRCAEGVLDLTDRQADWLESIHRSIARQRQTARAGR